MPFKPVQTAKCPKCGQSVYAAEEVMVSNNKYHRGCFKCSTCNKLLDATLVATHGTTIFCKTCYGRKFGPKGVGFGVGAGVCNMDGGSEELTWQNTNKRRSSSSSGPSKYGGGQKCNRCKEQVFAAEKLEGAGKHWHRKCFNCRDCNKFLDAGSIQDKDDEIYCKVCYGKYFGPKGVRGGGSLGATPTIVNVRNVDEAEPLPIGFSDL